VASHVTPQGGQDRPFPALLLVEDNSADVAITQRALREHHLAVDLIVVRDGQEALDYLLRQGRYAQSSSWRWPQLVLLDLNLPRVSGREVLEQVRHHTSLRSLPVVVLSTSARSEEVRDVYAAGANTYFEKPRDFQRFADLLQLICRYWLDEALLPHFVSG
jgi:two-component system response regulator